MTRWRLLLADDHDITRQGVRSMLEASGEIVVVGEAMDGAIDLAIDGHSPYPENAAFVEADSPHAGSEMERTPDDGYAVVLVSSDGRERIITAKTLAA